jgi:hypothetical protein
MAPPPVPAAKTESPALVPLPAPAVAPPVEPAEQGTTERSASPPSPKHAQAATKSARVAKARPAKKKAAAPKRTMRAAGPTHAGGGGASPARPATSAADSRHRADPDDTLPISE